MPTTLPSTTKPLSASYTLTVCWLLGLNPRCVFTRRWKCPLKVLNLLRAETFPIAKTTLLSLQLVPHKARVASKGTQVGVPPLPLLVPQILTIRHVISLVPIHPFNGLLFPKSILPTWGSKITIPSPLPILTLPTKWLPFIATLTPLTIVPEGRILPREQVPHLLLQESALSWSTSVATKLILGPL